MAEVNNAALGRLFSLETETPSGQAMRTSGVNGRPDVRQDGAVNSFRLPSIGCVLLAGGLKPTPLASGTGMSALWLFPDGERSILDNWIDHLFAIGEAPSSETIGIDVRIIVDKRMDFGGNARTNGSLRVMFEVESSAYRGPAGAAKDVAAEFTDDTTVLIVEANRWLASSLRPMIVEHVQRNADITVARQADGSPAGIVAANRKALDRAGARGFVDLKEQWLPSCMRAGLDVFVHTFDGPGASLVRTHGDLLRLSRRLSTGRDELEQALTGPALTAACVTEVERWSAVSSRADVHPTARIMSSVVMPGARVEEGAVVARSILPPGSQVRAGADVAEMIEPGDAATAMRMTRCCEEAHP